MTTTGERPLLIASLTGPDGDALRMQSAAARSHADWLEIRLDRLRGDPAEAVAPLRDDGLPLLLTLRSRHEGGEDDRDPAAAAQFLTAAAKPGDCLDWEAARGAPPEWPTERLVISHHISGAATANDLTQALGALIRHPARFHKLIFHARRLENCLDARDILRRARADGLRLCAFAMGEPGAPSRLLAPAWGSAAVFGAPPGWAGAAPGQLSLDAMTGLFRIRDITERTALLGVAGNPVLHSKSPELHNPALREAGLDAVYLPLPAEDFQDFLRFASRVNLRAASVTTPFKAAAFAHAGRTSPEADAARAVNTLLLKDGRPVFGSNTDGEGVVVPLTPWLHFPRMARVLIAGSGPAARAAGAALRKLGPEIEFTGRELPAIAEAGATPWIPPEAAAMRKYSILVNATPVLAPRWEPPLRAILDAAPPVLLEMSYRDERPAAYPPGVTVIPGLAMLRAQAAAQTRMFIEHMRCNEAPIPSA